MQVPVLEFTKFMDFLKEKRESGFIGVGGVQGARLDTSKLTFFEKLDGVEDFLRSHPSKIRSYYFSISRLLDTMIMVRQDIHDLAEYVKIDRSDGEVLIAIDRIETEKCLEVAIRDMMIDAILKNQTGRTLEYYLTLDTMLKELCETKGGILIAQRLWENYMPKNKPVPSFMSEEIKVFPRKRFSIVHNQAARNGGWSI